MRSITINVSVCLSVCLSTRVISNTTHPNFSKRFLYMLPVVEARSSSINAIRYVLPVLCMASCFHITEQIQDDACVSITSLGGGTKGEVCCLRPHLVKFFHLKIWQWMCNKVVPRNTNVLLHNIWNGLSGTQLTKSDEWPGFFWSVDHVRELIGETDARL